MEKPKPCSMLYQLTASTRDDVRTKHPTSSLSATVFVGQFLPESLLKGFKIGQMRLTLLCLIQPHLPALHIDATVKAAATIVQQERERALGSGELMNIARSCLPLHLLPGEKKKALLF